MHDPASGHTRWWVLGLLSVALFGQYYVFDTIAPLAEQLESQLGFSNTQIGMLNAVYSIPNIFLVLIGGLIVDRFGFRKVAVVTAAICLAGSVLTAVTGNFLTMTAGRFLFGVGADTLNVAVSVSLGIWFARYGVAFAYAVNLGVARAGSWVADLSPVWASPVYDRGWQSALWLSVGFASLCMLSVAVYAWVESRNPPPRELRPTRPDRMQWRDAMRFSTSFWLILALCVLFYSSIVPYRSTFSIKYFQHAHGLDLQTAAVINSYVYLATMIATPVFGWIADRFGRRAIAMVYGSLALPLAYIAAVQGGNMLWTSTVLLGLAYTLIPAILWPSVIKLVKAERLGTAFGLLFMLQNAGMAVCNLVAGTLNDLFGAGADNPAGYDAMMGFFFVLSFGALVFAVALWRREKGPHSHGLEVP